MAHYSISQQLGCDVLGLSYLYGLTENDGTICTAWNYRTK